MADIAVDGVGVELAPDVAAPAGLSAADRRRMALYFAGLIVLLGFPENLMSIPISFFLKNKLHMGAHQIALYGLVAAIPAYLAFVFGFARDLWNPFGLRDRGYMMLFGGLCAMWLRRLRLPPGDAGRSDRRAPSCSAVVALRASRSERPDATIAQQHVMSGQMSTVMNVFGIAPWIPLAAGGLLSDHLEGCR